MLITLPLSHLINSSNYNQIQCDIFQKRRQTDPKFYAIEHDVIFHDTKGFFEHDFFESLGDIDFLQYGDNGIYKEYYGDYGFYYSTSLSPACVDVDVVDGVYVPSSAEKRWGDLLSLAKQRILFFNFVFYEGKLSLENTAYRPGNCAYKIITDPEFIFEVIETNKVGFTFDVAHAMITAYERCFDYEEYVDQLPLNHCTELHISKPSGCVDSHGLPDKEVIKCLDYALSLIPSERLEDIYFVCEYYKDFEVLKKFYNEEMQRYANKVCKARHNGFRTKNDEQFFIIDPKWF